jgi:Uncharacterized protein conserved in bacteria
LAGIGAAAKTIPACILKPVIIKAIDYAIAQGLTRVEAGAQGEHKLARGYLPITNHSLHWFRDPGFAKAVSQYLVAEKAAVEQDIEILTSYGPFKKTQIEEQQ